MKDLRSARKREQLLKALIVLRFPEKSPFGVIFLPHSFCVIN